MGIEQFIKHIEAEFDDLKPGVLKPESNFREVFEWNSINALILIAMVKTENNGVMHLKNLISEVGKCVVFLRLLAPNIS